MIKLFLGDCTVGKTSVCKVFTGLEFSDEEMVTIGSDKFEKKFYLQNGKEIKLHYFMNKVDKYYGIQQDKKDIDPQH